MAVVTRFAPSPTGMLHIGGARTALFNLSFARRHGGQYLLRIEDTDKARSTSEAKEAILEGLDWLGLSPDAPPVFQSAQAGRHREVADAMLASGSAFKCYATPEALQARRDEGAQKREAARAEGLGEDARAELLAEADALLAPYRSPWRSGAPAPSHDAPFTVRLKAPDDGVIALDDAVQGRVEIAARELDDLILLRADGTPTYMLSVVVDDHDMGITHVLRGDDHLRNAFRQLPIYTAMGWQTPVFAHIPLIHGPDGKKLSKRHGAQSTLEFRALGYLPEAMCAYLLRLGWSDGRDDVLGLEAAAARFDLDGIGKAPARLDFDKLASVNQHALRQADGARLMAALRPFLEQNHTPSEAQMRAVQHALPLLVERAQTLPELADACRFLLLKRPLELNKKARKSLRSAGPERLEALRERLAGLAAFDAGLIASSLSEYCDAQELSMGQIGPPLRSAVTGGVPAPDLAPVLSWIGRDEVLARLDEQIAALRRGNETEEGAR